MDGCDCHTQSRPWHAQRPCRDGAPDKEDGFAKKEGSRSQDGPKKLLKNPEPQVYSWQWPKFPPGGTHDHEVE